MSVKQLTLALCAMLAMNATAGVPTDAPIQSHAEIRAAAVRGLRAVIDPSLPGVELEPAALDARLRLAPCQTALEAFVAVPRHQQSRLPVRVSCRSPSWTMHVPVEIRRRHSVLVLRRAVARGEQIAAADVNVQTRPLPGLGSPYLASPDQLAGRLARRPLAEGTPVPADALSAALLIHRGQAVTLLANANGFEVRAPGRAMADAVAQQRVRVQNLNSLKIVEGVADNGGVVRVLP
jgi:flagella basal body P-ring formation protein FlgA